MLRGEVLTIQVNDDGAGLQVVLLFFFFFETGDFSV